MTKIKIKKSNPTIDKIKDIIKKHPKKAAIIGSAFAVGLASFFWRRNKK